jgi:hypothetical protein
MALSETLREEEKISRGGNATFNLMKRKGERFFL